MKKATLFSVFTIVLLMPTTLYLGTRLTGQGYYLTATLLIIEAMLPFFFTFEGRRPQARELVILAVMAALAAISRSAFAFLPHFKPITALVMITGIAFGAQAGFLTGALSAFASNFLFGQGFWTPWQMMAYGFGGFLAGLLFHKRHVLSQKPLLFSSILAVFSFFTIILFVGPLLDCSSLFIFSSKLTWEYVVSVFSVGFPINLIHAISSAVTMLLFSGPMLAKLTRLQTKYGMLENLRE